MAQIEDYATVLSVKPSYCTLYRRNEQYVKGSRKMTEAQLANIRGKKYTGKVTQKSVKSMTNAVGWLLSLAKSKKAYNPKFNSWFDFRVSFITLTLSTMQFNDDREIKRTLLNDFLIYGKRKWNLVNYVWRAETQANGNIHFHILSDVFIPWDELRKVWNDIQLRHGYIVDSAKDKNPNSTDIHSLKTIGNVEAYISKYYTKNDESRRMINGKIYGVSDGLNRVRACQIVMDESKAKELRKAIKKNKIELVKKDYATIVYMPVRELINEVNFAFKEIREYINAVYYNHEVEFDELMQEGYDIREAPRIQSKTKINQLNLFLN